MISYIAKSYSIHHMTYRHVGVHGENILHACMHVSNRSINANNSAWGPGITRNKNGNGMKRNEMKSVHA